MALLIDGAMIRSLSRKEDVVAEFPFLRARRVGRNCCGERATLQYPDFQKVKYTISALSPARRKRLCNLLGVSAIRLIYSQDGRAIDVTLSAE